MRLLTACGHARILYHLMQELRDMRHVHPRGMQAGAGDLLDARQRFEFDRPELRLLDDELRAAGAPPFFDNAT